MNHKGLRYNTGKLKMSLLPRYAINELAKIITRGSEKYLPRNWENGMAWTTVLDSLKRHLLEFENCKDYDPETQCLHIAHVMCNAAFLTEYYKIYPQGDDRRGISYRIQRDAIWSLFCRRIRCDECLQCADRHAFFRQLSFALS